MTSISTLSFAAPLQTSIAQAQVSLGQVETEISSGMPADLGLSLGAGTGTVLSFKSQIDQLNAYTSSNSIATTRLSATSSALTQMLSTAQSLSADLVTASTAGTSTGSVQTSAEAALDSLVAGLNTSVGGESVFGGINTTATPVASYTQSSAAAQSVDSAFSSAFGTTSTSSAASSISASDMQSFLSNQFASLFSGSSWQSNWSSASDTTMSTTVSPSQTVSTSVSANNAAFRQIAEAYTMLSQFTGTNSTLSSSAQATVVSTATSLLNAGISALTNVQATVGTAQSTISSANDNISAQVSVLQTSVSNVDSVDTSQLSSRLTSLETQLEASYEMTSRLSSLSLVNYLTSAG